MYIKLRGFSLLEVLLLGVILSILFGLLLPVMVEARHQVRVGACSGNLRRIGQALALYHADYDRYPDPFTLTQTLPRDVRPRCPEDPDPGYGSASYTFRGMLPPEFKPYWEFPRLDPNVVVATCTHHLGQARTRVGGRELTSPPKYPCRIVLRAGGSVGLVDENRLREVYVPGKQARSIRAYPGEPFYELYR